MAEWLPSIGKRSVGSPVVRWENDIVATDDWPVGLVVRDPDC